MSNRNNDVFQVLVTKGNQAVLGAGVDIATLAVGQLGAFDANTNVSIGAATNPMPRDFYLAVGVDKTGSGTLEDIRTSAGQMIQKKGITAYSFKPHSAGRPKIVKVGEYTGIVGDTDYGIKVEFRNSRISNVQGQNTFTKSFVVRTPTGTTDANVLTKLLVNEVKLDVTKMLSAVITARQPLTALTHGTSVDYADNAVMTEADLNALILFNKTAIEANKVYTDFTLQSTAVPGITNFQTNLGFYKFLETNITVSAVEGFNSNVTVSTVQELAYEEGSGRNVKHKEYHSSSYNGSGPYVLSETTGMAKGDILYLAVDAVKYDQFALEYFMKSESGWLEYENTLSTFIAVPATETVTRASVATLLDALVVGGAFEPLADDAAAANVGPTVVEADPASVAVDGLA
jgi:hypothetical protein